MHSKRQSDRLGPLALTRWRRLPLQLEGVFERCDGAICHQRDFTVGRNKGHTSSTGENVLVHTIMQLDVGERDRLGGSIGWK